MNGECASQDKILWVTTGASQPIEWRRPQNFIQSSTRTRAFWRAIWLSDALRSLSQPKL